MIKPAEFRPGSLIQSGKGIYRVYAVSARQVLAIQDYKEPIDSEQKVCPADNAIINPIPITKEWLVRLGFDIRESSTCKQYYIGENEVTHDWLFDLVWLDKPELIGANNVPFYRNGRHEIHFVHQLQNLYFALTGEELTVNDLNK